MSRVGPLVRRAARTARRLAVKADLLAAAGPRDGLRLRRMNGRLQELRAHRPRIYRRIWEEAAAELGAAVREAGDGALAIVRGSAETIVREEVVRLGDDEGVERSFDKPLVHRLLHGAGLPVPAHVELLKGTGDEAAALLAAGPCVVKPARGTGVGAGVSGGVETARQLAKAVRLARTFAPDVLVERQVAGDVYRLLMLDGVLVDAIRRRPPRVTGDGRSSVAALIESENRRRLDARGERGLWLLRLDYDALFELARRGLTPRAVLGPGETVAVKTVTSQNASDENETVLSWVCSALAEEAARAAHAVGLRLAGIDVVTPSLASSLRESGGAVIEANGRPGLHHHYLVADRARATRVATPVLRALLEGGPG